jgi:hypothetical protein
MMDRLEDISLLENLMDDVAMHQANIMKARFTKVMRVKLRYKQQIPAEVLSEQPCCTVCRGEYECNSDLTMLPCNHW